MGSLFLQALFLVFDLFPEFLLRIKGRLPADFPLYLFFYLPVPGPRPEL